MDIVQIQVGSRRKDTGVTVYLEALCVPEICSPLRNQNIEVAVEQHEHLKALNLADFTETNTSMEIDLLIGLDFYFSFVKGEVRRGTHGPVAVDTILGWVICGSYKGESVSQLLCTTHTLRLDTVKNVDEPLTKLMNKFWKVDSLGVGSEAEVVKSFENNISFNGKRYVVKLPIKPHHDPLPDNYKLTTCRLKSMLSKLRNDPSLLKEYDQVIQGYIKDEILEVVPPDDTAESNVHYLPHRAVVKQDRETTKVRVVMDASAKLKNEPSLNDCLYTGPCLLPMIYDIILRFRLGKIGIMADIQQAFLNIEITEEHRNLLRILWPEDILKEKSINLILRFTRVLFGLTCSPFLLNATVDFLLRKFINEGGDLWVLLKLLRALYVDDVNTNVDDEAEGTRFYDKAKYYFAQGGFNLRKWATNDKKLQNYMDAGEHGHHVIDRNMEDELSYAKEELGASTKYKKVLGINWDLDRDEFVFEVEKIASSGLAIPYTKRNILKISATFYDPVGFICPIVLQAKLLFQKLCSMKLDWDEAVTGEIGDKWERFLNELFNYDSLRVERFILGRVSEKILQMELHGFCDSSEVAYAGVVYAKIVTNNGIQVKLLSGKSKVAPLKKVSIPRLELLSCLLLAKLMISVKNAVEVEVVVERCIFWSDAEIALHWIKNTKKEWKPWVENRVNEIRDRTSCNDWRQVPGDLNPADLATREGVLEDIMSERWLKGPKFLLNEEQCWPVQKEYGMNQPNSVLIEVKQPRVEGIEIAEINTCLITSETQGIQNVINVMKFNSFLRLCRTTVFVLRFINNTKKFAEKKYDAIIKDEEVKII